FPCGCPSEDPLLHVVDLVTSVVKHPEPSTPAGRSGSWVNDAGSLDVFGPVVARQRVGGLVAFLNESRPRIHLSSCGQSVRFRYGGGSLHETDCLCLLVAAVGTSTRYTVRDERHFVAVPPLGLVIPGDTEPLKRHLLA